MDFNSIENNHTLHREEDCMENICTALKSDSHLPKKILLFAYLLFVICLKAL